VTALRRKLAAQGKISKNTTTSPVETAACRSFGGGVERYFRPQPLRLFCQGERAMVKKAGSARSRTRTLGTTASKSNAAVRWRLLHDQIAVTENEIDQVRAALSKPDPELLRRQMLALLKVELAFLAYLERSTNTAGAGQELAATSPLRPGCSEPSRRPCSEQRRRRAVAGRRSGRESAPCSAKSARGQD
jgi:hypothetical protein